MEDVIAVLPTDVIDQIAAGEVIERPASVVKELVDNALDAGARSIAIDAQAGGRLLMRVVDDGAGMSPTDAVRAFERHATSKIRRADDLWTLSTMGFRGEALPAIASVSRLVLTTRRAQDLAATRIVVEAGQVVARDEVGAPAGTTVEVSQLFANVPARLKFLKAEATEATHISELCARFALAHPRVHVTLRHNGRTALDAPPDRDLGARAQLVLGTRATAGLVDATAEEGGVRVRVLLGAPELAQTTARGVQLFVGRRWVRDRGLLHAVCMGYGELVPRGRYPVAIALVEFADGHGDAVDLNVHPQKLEVRFREPAVVAAAVRHAVQRGVARAPWRDQVAGVGPVLMTAIAGVAPPALPYDGPATPLAQRYADDLRGARERFQPELGLGLDDRDGSPRAWASRIHGHVRSSRAAEARHDAKTAAAYAEFDAHDRVPHEPDLAFASGSAPVASAVDADDRHAAFALAPAYFASLRYLGQLDLTFLICEAAGELVLIDQHVAHERVELARLRAALAGREIATQRLLFPTTIDASSDEVALAGGVRAVLARAGYEVEPFGPTSLAVKAVPAGIRHGDPSQLLRELLASWTRDGAPSEDELADRILAEVACHSVVRAGDRLQVGEAEALIRALDGLDVSANGPHGRPAVLRLPLAEIARRFGR